MLIRNSAIYVASRIVAGLLASVTTALLTRMLLPAQYAIYGLALVTMTFGWTAGFDWLNTTFLRFAQKRRGEQAVIDTFVQIFLVLAAACLVLAALVLLAGGHGAAPRAYAIGLVMVCGLGWSELTGRFAIGNFQPGRYTFLVVTRAGCVAVGALGAAWLTHDAVWTAIGSAAGLIAGGAAGGRWGFRWRTRHFDPALARAVLAFGLPLGISTFLGSVVSNGSRWLVGEIGSAEQFAFYTAAFILVQNTLQVIAGGIVTAAYSMAVRALEMEGADAARRQLMANGSLLIAVMAPAALGMALTAQGVAQTLVGPHYVAAVQSLTPLLAATAFFTSLRAHHLDHAFQLGHRPFLQVRVTACTAVVAVTLSLLLIPRMGAAGAAVATLVAAIGSCVQAWSLGRRAFAIPLPWAAAGKVGVGCLAMTAAVLAVPLRGGWAFPAQAACGAVAYGACGFALDLLQCRRHLAALLPARFARALPGG